MALFDPLEELRDILSPARVSEGRVTRLAGRNAVVATSRGVISAQVSSELAVRVGDRVRLEGTVVTARVPGKTLPVFTI